MNTLKTRKNNRKLKRRILKFLNLFKFKSKNLDFFSKILFIWVILSIISLFLPWMIDSEKNYNSFNLIIWLKGYFIFLLDLFILFITISNKRKENFKLNTRFFFKDHYVIIFSWILLFIFSLTSYFTISWLQTNNSLSYIYWKWLIMSFVSSIIIIFSWIWLAKLNKKNNISLVTNESKENLWKDEYNSKNMKLPFDY